MKLLKQLKILLLGQNTQALEYSLCIKGTGWSTETLKAIKDLISSDKVLH